MDISDIKITPAILLVDDDRNITSLLEANLQSAGYRVVIVRRKMHSLYLLILTAL